MNASERAEALLTARLLRAGSKLDLLSTGITLLTIAALLFGSIDRLIGMLAVVIGIFAKLYAVRVALDAKLFEDLAEERLTLTELDSALTSLQIAPAKRANRPLSARCLGAKRLVVIEGMLAVAQIAVLMVATVVRIP